MKKELRGEGSKNKKENIGRIIRTRKEEIKEKDLCMLKRKGGGNNGRGEGRGKERGKRWERKESKGNTSEG